jgi:hypothetical protein
VVVGEKYRVKYDSLHPGFLYVCLLCERSPVRRVTGHSERRRGKIPVAQNRGCI